MHTQFTIYNLYTSHASLENFKRFRYTTYLDPFCVYIQQYNKCMMYVYDRLCGLVVRVLGYRSGDPGSIPGTTRKKVVCLERGPLSLVSKTEELLDRKVAAPV
jgi:hypothetical protein